MTSEQTHNHQYHELIERLQETIAWCQPRANLTAPADCLRTAELRPSNISAELGTDGYYDIDWRSIEERRLVVNEIAMRRRKLLHVNPNSFQDAIASINGGRLLIYAPDDNDASGLSESETQGFLDIYDAPPWDTWICYVYEPTLPDIESINKTQEILRSSYYGKANPQYVDNWQPPAFASYVLCWIPAEFIDSVEMGTKVVPCDCIHWARDAKIHHDDSQFLHFLSDNDLLF